MARPAGAPGGGRPSLECQRPQHRCGQLRGGPAAGTCSQDNEEPHPPTKSLPPRGKDLLVLTLLPQIKRAGEFSQHLYRENGRYFAEINHDQTQSKTKQSKTKKPLSPEPAFEKASAAACSPDSARATKWPGHLRGREEQTGATFINKPSSFFIRDKNSKVPHTTPCGKREEWRSVDYLQELW